MPQGRGFSRAARVWLGGALCGLLTVSSQLVGQLPTSGQTAPGSNWTVYHGQATGSGLATSSAPLTPLSRAWTSPRLDGDLYGEPLVFGNRVLVATERDSVYALSARSGAVLWHRHLTTPVPSSQLPCGDIAPQVGITGTPVIDAARGEIFVVADGLVNGVARHTLYGLDMYTGQVLLHQRADPPGSDPTVQLQRPGLNIDNDQVVFAFGGNDGDCGDYHGWAVSIPESGGALHYFETTPSGRQGAIWMGGAAPEVDAKGNIWLSTGNGSVTEDDQPWDYGNGVLELSPALTLEQFFATSTWAQDNANDEDLGSASPALLQGGDVIQAGKSHTAFLLNRANLGGIGGQLAQLPLCPGDVDGGTSVHGNVAYLPCSGGLVAVRASTTPSPTITKLWHATNSAPGGAIIDGSYLYSIDRGTESLVVLKRSNGQIVRQIPIGSVANHFGVPTIADGLLLATSARKVQAFDGPDGLPRAPTLPG